MSVYGNVVGNIAPTPDTTLSIAGKSADAKATGDALVNKLNTTGGTMTGALTMSGSSYIMTPTIFFSNDSSAPYEVGVYYSDTVKDDSNAVTAVILRLGCAYHDEPIILRNIADPISSSDVANKQYVDSRIIVSPTEPTGVSENALWLDTSETSLVNADEVSY